MKLKQRFGWFKNVLGDDRAGEVSEGGRWRSADDVVEVDTFALTREEIDLIKVKAKGEIPRLFNKIVAWEELQTNFKNIKVTTLEKLEVALIESVRATEHQFVFQEDAAGVVLPYYVTSVKYHKGHYSGETWNPPYVDLRAEAVSLNEKEVISRYWYRRDIKGGELVVRLLEKGGLYLETKEAFGAWQASLHLFHEIYRGLGVQYHARGMAFFNAGRYSMGVSSMEREGNPSRVVMDFWGDEEEGAVIDSRADDSFWSRGLTKKKKKETDEDEEDESEDSSYVSLPIHPYVTVFDFEKHMHADIHVSNLEPYPYASVENKLVLPKDVKQLVGLLIDGASSVMEDIVKGKSGGVVVLATGSPGTGKTLTAEVYSEQIKKPLYAVQCSQLGTSEEELEKKLALVLKRATRWRAILLIDEADVYVRSRGDDIQQNAIVGVFLRLLEYYRGIMFLTSNRATEIDDAILSRAIAHIKYELPSDEDLKRIWMTLSDNYGVVLFPKDVARLVKALPGISGRNVKNLLKIVRVVDPRLDNIVDTIIQCSKFIDLPKETDQRRAEVESK